jgi:predicted DNA-binding protein (UPF0251 family)
MYDKIADMLESNGASYHELVGKSVEETDDAARKVLIATFANAEKKRLATKDTDVIKYNGELVKIARDKPVRDDSAARYMKAFWANAKEMQDRMRKEREAELLETVDPNRPIEPILSSTDVVSMLAQANKLESEIIRSYHLEYLSYKEIASKLKIGQKTVVALLGDCRARISRGVKSNRIWGL